MKFLKSFFDGKFIYPVLAASLDLGYWGNIVNSTLNVKYFFTRIGFFPKSYLKLQTIFFITKQLNLKFKLFLDNAVLIYINYSIYDIISK